MTRPRRSTRVRSRDVTKLPLDAGCAQEDAIDGDLGTVWNSGGFIKISRRRIRIDVQGNASWVAINETAFATTYCP